MVWTRPLCVAALLLSLAACGATPEARTVLPPPPPQPTRVAGEYIVTTEAGAGADAVKHVFARFDVAAIRPLGHNRFLLRFTHDPGIERVRHASLDSDRIRTVQENFLYRTR